MENREYRSVRPRYDHLMLSIVDVRLGIFLSGLALLCKLTKLCTISLVVLFDLPLGNPELERGQVCDSNSHRVGVHNSSA